MRQDTAQDIYETEDHISGAFGSALPSLLSSHILTWSERDLNPTMKKLAVPKRVRDKMALGESKRTLMETSST